MELAKVSPQSLRKESNSALLNMHYHTHMLYEWWKKGRDIPIEDVKKAHDLIVDEFVKREMEKEGEHKSPMALQEQDLAKIYPSGEKKGKKIALKNLPQFGDFYLGDRFISLVGSLPNNGETENDIDFLIAWPEDAPDEITRPIKFRLWRQFQDPKLQARCSFHLDSFHGPFTNSVPLYRLKCERINHDMDVILAALKREPTAMAQAEQSKKADKIDPRRFFYPQKATKALAIRKKLKGPWDYSEAVKEAAAMLPVVAEKKYDGMRIILNKDNGWVRIMTDGGTDVTSRLPMLVAQLKKIPHKSFVLDAELEWWGEGVHQPREEVAAALMSKEELDEKSFIANVFEILYLNGKDLHNLPWNERHEQLKKFPIKREQLEFKADDEMLNRVPSLIAEKEAELAKHIKTVSEAKASEGAIIKSATAPYPLTGATKHMVKAKKYATVFGKVIKRNPTKVATVFNYDYAIKIPDAEVDPASVVDIGGKKYSRAGTSYSTTEKLNPGDVFVVSFHTVNVYTDPETGKVSAHFYEPVYGGKVARTEPHTLGEVEAIARDAGLLGEKEGKQTFTEGIETIFLKFLGTKGYIEEESPKHKKHTAVIVLFDNWSGLIDFGETWKGKYKDIEKMAEGTLKWIALTHAHPDHVDGLEGEEIDIPVYMTEETDKLLPPEKYPMTKRIVGKRKKGTKFDLGRKVKLEFVPVEHSSKAPTVGLKLTLPHDVHESFTIGFFPDVADVDERDLAGVDFYVGDGSSPTKPIMRGKSPEGEDVGHASMKQQLKWCQDMGIHSAAFIHQGKQSVEMDDQKVIDLLQQAFPNKEILLPDDGEVLQLPEHAVKDGVYLTPPHGELFWNGEKDLLVKAKEFHVLSQQPHFLASDLVYGVIKFKKPKKITLDEFNKLRNRHQISEDERKKWWPDKDELYAYEIESFYPWRTPRKYQFIKGAQTIIKNLQLVETAKRNIVFASSTELKEVAYVHSRKKFAGSIVNKFPQGTKVVFDPMCGTASVLVEAARRGMTVVGNDLNPYAYFFAKGVFEGIGLDSEDMKALLFPPEREGWFAIHYKGKHPTNKVLRAFVDSVVLNTQEAFKGKEKKRSAAMAAVVSFLGRFFRGTHTGIASNWYYQDVDKSRAMLRSSILEVNNLIQQVGGKGTITNVDAFSMEIPEADVILLDPPLMKKGIYRPALSEYKTRNSILLQDSFRFKKDSARKLESLLEKLAKKCKTLVVVPEDESELDWESLLAKCKKHVKRFKMSYFKKIRTPSAVNSVSKSRIQKMFLAEQGDPYLLVPDESKTLKYMVHHHWRGKGCHADVRFDSKLKGMLIGWTLDDLMPGIVTEPVLTAKDAVQKEASPDKYFKINWKTGIWKKRLKKGQTTPVNVTIMTQKKAPEPIEWMTFEGVVEPGQVGATKNFPGVFIIIDRGKIEYGAQKPWSHEYFFNGKALDYKVVMRQLKADFGEALKEDKALQRHLILHPDLFDEEGLEESIRELDRELLESLPDELFKGCFVTESRMFIDNCEEQKIIPPSEEKVSGVKWFTIKTIDQTPYVLSDEAVKKKWMPPLGKSALPKVTRDAIPAALRYWNAKKPTEAMMIRDELVELLKKDEISLPKYDEQLKEAQQGRYVLNYHWFAKIGQKKRAGASEFHFDLFLLDGKKEHFELDLDPQEHDTISAHLPDKDMAHSEKLTGFIKPGTIPGNPTKETGSWIESWASGKMLVLEDKPDFKKVRFTGKLNGVWTFKKESPEADFWEVERSQPAPVAAGA